MKETSEKSLIKSGFVFESIEDYRQRTGKSKAEMTVQDYTPLIFNALKAVGFVVGDIGVQCSYHRDEKSGDMVVSPWNEFGGYIVHMRLDPED